MPRPEGRERKRAHVGFRVTPEMKRRLEATAEGSGRSLSQEVELRLERSIEMEELDTTGALEIIRQMTHAFVTGGKEAARKRSVAEREWASDPICFEAGVLSLLDEILVKMPLDAFKRRESQKIYSEMIEHLAGYAGMIVKVKWTPEDDARAVLLAELMEIEEFEAEGRVRVKNITDELESLAKKKEAYRARLRDLEQGASDDPARMKITRQQQSQEQDNGDS